MLPKDGKNGRGWQRGCSGLGLGDPLRWDSPAAAWGLGGTALKVWGRVLGRDNGLGAGTVPGAAGRSQWVEGGAGPILRGVPWD